VFQILWEFEVDESSAPGFEQAYGGRGAWVALFSESPAFVGTELFRRAGLPPLYLTLDRWTTRAEYEAFRRERATEYARLDAACERLTQRERFLTAWES
jgi:heme-degrading monooxygenase HmoA